MSIEIESAAAALVQARAEAATAADALDRAKGAQERVQQRVDALRAERAGIVAAARKGSNDPQNALRVGCIDMDLSDLGPLVAEQAKAVSTAQAEAGNANAAVAGAQQALDAAANADLLLRLLAHADRLDELLRTTLGEISAIDRRTGRRPSWAPSPALATELQRLHLNAGLIRR